MATKVDSYKKIAEFGKQLLSDTSLDNALLFIADQARDLVHADRCSIFMYDKEADMLWTKLADGIGRIAISTTSGIAGDTYTKGEAQVVNDPYTDKRFLTGIDKKSGYETKNMITVPIFDSQRVVIGLFQLLNKSDGDFLDEDLKVLTFFANYISGTLELSFLMKDE
ncbi:GAF domain-containing protein [Sulfurimonas sp. MAG313]|nr:GAF domain-containing protein [Sulfurimonas sp. MAG313]MDF1881184.1 GAF domain-containing protein [Sulfurimonas sp. MAG313]